MLGVDPERVHPNIYYRTSKFESTACAGGLTLCLVEYPDGPSGDLSESITCQIGAAVGDPDALVRLTA